jgi:hypothetical protein
MINSGRGNSHGANWPSILQTVESQQELCQHRFPNLGPHLDSARENLRCIRFDPFITEPSSCNLWSPSDCTAIESSLSSGSVRVKDNLDSGFQRQSVWTERDRGTASLQSHQPAEPAPDGRVGNRIDHPHARERSLQLLSWKQDASSGNV